jgi:hypothetical protein
MGREDSEGKRREGMEWDEGERQRKFYFMEKGDGKECQEGIERDDEKGIEREGDKRDWEEKDWEEMGKMRRNGKRRSEKGWEDERNEMGRYVRKGMGRD